MAFPRILIAGLRGGSGKTIVSLGLIASLRKRGMAVAPFKKGPDFIDAGWLALAAGHPCHNLDTFLIPSEKNLLSFIGYSRGCDISVVEGNRGLYDGMDVEGSVSTAELAKLLDTPVALVVDCTKSTRTVAALVLGCMQFDPDVSLAGVVLNQVAGPRHEAILRASIETFCHLPVLGAIKKLKKNAFPERHMGLVPTPEHIWASESIEQAVAVAEEYLDIEGILAIAEQAGRRSIGTISAEIAGNTALFEQEDDPASGNKSAPVFLKASSPRIGVIRDAAFQFYYPENLDALEASGAEIVMVSALDASELPPVDGLYIGGGFPETHARALAMNKRFREDVLRCAKQGLPIYAECGGLMYLGESLVLDDGTYPMVGVLPVVFGFSKRPKGHGYSVFEVDEANPFFEVGTQVRGHEFHYSHLIRWRDEKKKLAFKMIRGGGLDGKRDGLCFKNTLATYTHLHALGIPSWANAMIRAAIAYRDGENG